MRHKFIAYLDWSEELFGELEEKGFISEKYEYTNLKKAHCGNVYILTFAKEKSLVVASRTSWTHSWRDFYGRRRKKYTREMWKLTPEGAQFIKELIVEQKL